MSKLGNLGNNYFLYRAANKGSFQGREFGVDKDTIIDFWLWAKEKLWGLLITQDEEGKLKGNSWYVELNVGICKYRGKDGVLHSTWGAGGGMLSWGSDYNAFPCNFLCSWELTLSLTLQQSHGASILFPVLSDSRNELGLWYLWPQGHKLWCSHAHPLLELGQYRFECH